MLGAKGFCAEASFFLSTICESLVMAYTIANVLFYVSALASEDLVEDCQSVLRAVALKDVLA